MPKNQAERLAIEAHASYIIICSLFSNKPTARNFGIKERAANRLYRRYQLAFGK